MPQRIYDASRDLIAVLPKESIYKELIQDSIQELNLAARHVNELRSKMNELASMLPEYSTVMHMNGVGKTPLGLSSSLRLAWDVVVLIIGKRLLLMPA